MTEEELKVGNGRTNSKTVMNALLKTKYIDPVTKNVRDLSTREVVQIELHPNIAQVQSFAHPNSTLEWISMDDDTLGVREVITLSKLI